eukprot:6193381-Pleurochrysis_carterae.AAC.1
MPKTVIVRAASSPGHGAAAGSLLSDVPVHRLRCGSCCQLHARAHCSWFVALRAKAAMSESCLAFVGQRLLPLYDERNAHALLLHAVRKCLHPLYTASIVYCTEEAFRHFVHFSGWRQTIARVAAAAVLQALWVPPSQGAAAGCDTRKLPVSEI